MTARILVIDDEPSIRSALDRVLRREGYEVLTASGVDTAHAILSETVVDAILLDLRMPKMSGESLYLSMVRRWPSLRGCRSRTTRGSWRNRTHLRRSSGCER